MQNEIRRPSPIIGWIAVALLASLGSLGTIAAPPAPADTAPEINNALLLPQDRQLEQWLEAARQSLDASDFGSATVMLQRIMQADEESFVAIPGHATFVTAREQAMKISTRLPEELRARFEADVDRSAREARIAAKHIGSAEAVAAFATRYRASLSGLEALQLLAATHRDSGRHDQAAIAWQAVAGHPRATKAQRAIAGIASIESLLATGKVNAAEQTARDPRWGTGDGTVLVAGKGVVPKEWIARRLREARQAQSQKALPAGESVVSVLPALQPVWSRETSTVVELQETVTQIQRYFREQGVVSSHAIRPVIAGNIVMTRTMLELVAFDVASGEQLWSVPNHEYAWITKRSTSLGSPPIRSTTASGWHRRTEADSVFGSLSTDGKLVVVVQEPERVESSPSKQGQNSPNQPVANPRWNQLCGYEITSRQLRWQVGNRPTGPADVLGGITFLGTPLFVDDLLFVVSRKDDDLSLLAMDRDTGHLRWSVKLGSLAPHLADSIARRRVACPVTLVDGLLLCPTASGTLAAVNPTTRSLEWAYRYPVVQHDLPIRPGNATTAPVPPDVWWNEWREVTCVAAETAGRVPKVVLMASPDSDQLQALNVIDGTALWSAPRSGALHFAGIAGDVAIVIEPMAVRAHDVRTGRLKWRAESGEISGRGTIFGSQFLQPRRAGGFAVINLADGTQSYGLTGTDAVYGTLVPCDGGWISQTDQSMNRLPLLETVRRRTQARWENQPSETTSLELARLDLQAGDPVAARRRMEGISTAEAKSLRRDAILAILRSLSTAAGNSQPKLPPEVGGLTPARSEDTAALGRELLGLCESNEERLVALRALGDAAWAAGDSVGAMTFFLNGLDLVDAIGLRSLSSWSVDEAASRTVRADRVLLGSIQRILDEARQHSPMANSTLLRELEQTLDARLAAALRSDDLFAVQRLVDRLSPLEWARRTLLANPTQALYARPLQKSEPILLSAAGSRNPLTSASALQQLAEIQTKSGWRTDAEAIQRRMLVDHADTPLADGQTLAAALASRPELAELRRRLLTPVPDLWPGRLPNVEKETKRNLEVYVVPVRIQASPGSPLDRLDVCVDRGGRDVWFTGDGHSGTWKARLPGPPRSRRSGFANQDQVEAYGVGRLLVLRVGSEVFGILPFNERGEPRAESTSLQVDIASGNEGSSGDVDYPDPVPAKVGIRHESFRLMDGFGRPAGSLGPVRPSYLCYRSYAKLVAVDTQTGRRLWERLDLPPNCQVLGDDDYVYLWRTDDRTLQTLSAIDGRSINERPWNVSPDDVLMHHGSRVWSVVRMPVTSVELTDARDGATVWSRQFPPNSIPFAMDQTAVAVLEPGGLLHLLAAGSGVPLGEALTVEMPEKVERIVCLQDAQRWYVAISGPVPRLSNLQADQLWGGLRVSFVHGWLYGIERQTAGIAWRRFLDSEPLPQNASHAVPLLVQMWRRSYADGESVTSTMGTLRLFDTRTGRDVLTHRHPALQPYYVLIPGENHEKLDLQTERETFQLNYNTSDQETQQERASDKKP